MYKQSISARNLLTGAHRLLSATSQDNQTVVNLKRVLVVSKLSRFEYERNRCKHLSEKELENHLRRRGTDYDKLLHHHHLHKNFEARLVTTLKNLGAEVEIANRYSYSDKLIEWADIIIPTGGDGTFLLAASKILDNKKPIIGLNSDPKRSEGYLCLPKKYSANIDEVFSRLQKGQFKWLMRSRIRISLSGEKGLYTAKNMHSADMVDELADLKNISIELKGEEPARLPSLALNEVFIGESVSARVSYLEMWLNQEQAQTILKCSGLLLATGTGSTAWHRSINRIPVQTVAELLRLLDIEPTEGKNSLATVLADIYNKNLVFNPEDKNICYTIRDLISAGVWPQPKGIKSRGFSKNIKVKSHCYSANLVIDGGVAYPFNDGMVAELEMQPADALRTIILPFDEGCK